MNSAASDTTKRNEETVLELLQNRAERFAERPAVRMKSENGWCSLTYGQLAERSIKLSSYLIEAGLKSGEPVAILSEARNEWAIAFFAAILAGAIVVPLDVKLTETELTSILSDCDPVFLFCDSKHRDVGKILKQKINSIRDVFLVEEGKGDGENKSIDQLLAVNLQNAPQRNADEQALFVYTSGTTGNPKGVIISFGNLIFQVNSFENVVNLSPEDRFLSVLPLNHLLELTGGFLGVLNVGGCVCFCHSIFPQEISRLLHDEKITGMIGVPLLFKSLKGGIEREIKRKGEGALERFQAAMDQAEALTHSGRRQLFAAILEQLGGSLRVLISGGAPLELDVARFFERLGIPMLQGYGLTETSPVISGNSLKSNKLGSVGQALKRVEIKINKKSPQETEGEILTRGPHVMIGYHGRDDLTNEVVDGDGWFHTGDLGHLDEDGFLYITGRIKNMIVLGGGKKIFPEEVEAAFSLAHTIKELCVLGKKSKEGFKEGTEEVCAVVVPADALADDYKNDKKAVFQKIKAELDELGQNLASYKRPTKIMISADELPKTATRKIKRAVVLEWANAQKEE